MDWKNFGYSILSVYGLMFIVGTLISWISTYFQCQKASISNLKWGSIYASFPTLAYILGRYFEILRIPFVNTVKSYLPNVANQIGLGWLVVFSLTLPATIMIIHYSEKEICTPDVNEMALFKTKMLAELQSKEEEKEKNAST